MAKCKTMTQCKMECEGILDVAWIPSKFAKKGNDLEIKGRNGWKVLEVWESRPIDEVRDLERDHLRTREASDI